MKRTPLCLSIAIAVLALAAPAAAQESPVDSLALARQYSAWLWAGEADSLLAHSAGDMRTRYAEPPGYAAVTEMLATRAGTETAVEEETWKLRNGDCQYWRTARVTGMEGLFLMRWILDPSGRITGMGLGPAAQAPPVDAETCGPDLAPS